MYRGVSTASTDQVIYGGFPGGRFCGTEGSRFIFSVPNRVLTFLYRTDGSGSGRGLEIAYDLSGKMNSWTKVCKTTEYVLPVC